MENKFKENEKEPSEMKKHILVNKKKNFINRLSYIKSGKKEVMNQHLNKSKNNFEKDRINNVECLHSNRDKFKSMNINNYQFEIKEKDIIFKNNGKERTQLLGKIFSEFDLNNNEANNIFDENYQNFTFSKRYNNSINFRKDNKIQEIKIENMKLKSNNKIKSSSDFKNKRPSYELEIKDNNIQNIQFNCLNTEINNNILDYKGKTSNYNYINTETLSESVRNRNRPKNLCLNNFTYNVLFNKANTYKDFHKTPKNRMNNNINNINNISNNISLNNRYNFYIKIGKTHGNELKKENQNINCEIKLDSHNNKNKEEISSKLIKNIIKNYEINNLNSINNNVRKEINVKTKPSFKKLEVQTVLNNNNINKESRNKKNKTNANIRIQRANTNANHSFNKTNFKFLVHQACENKIIRKSFNKYFKSNASMKIRSQSNRNNKNNSINYSNLVNNTEIDFEKNSDKKNIFNKNLKSFCDIGLTKRDHKFSEKKSLKIFNINNIGIINYKRNINSNKNKIKHNLNEINNSKKYSQTQRIIYNFENNNIDNKVTNRESHHHSKVNSSFSSLSINSNFNSITNLTNTNLNMNMKNNNNILSPKSLVSTNYINLEILYVLQEKLKLICENLKKSKNCSKASFEFINYYFNQNFSNEIINLLKSSSNQNIIIKCIKIELLCNFLLYDISFEEEIKEIEIILKTIFNLLYKNLLLTISFVISEYKNKNNNIIVVLNKIVQDNVQKDELYEDYKKIEESKYIQIIENNFNKIIDYYDMVIENIYLKRIDENNKISFNDCINSNNPKILSRNKFEIVISNFFIESHKKLSDYMIESLKKFFYSFLSMKESFYKSIKSKPKQNTINNDINTNNQIHFLLPKIREHKYTLILDLDETLIYSQINFNYKINHKHNYNNQIILPKTTLILRPGLNEFLHDMKLLYELILFSTGTPEYVDPIVKKIEKDEKYFDYVLYRNHMTIDENGDNIKNLNLIGRNLNSVIIIDDVYKNFKLQKDNGICIRPFCGNCSTDGKTLKTLNNVLQKIRFNVDETNDIRISLKKYKYLLYPIVISEKEQ